MCSVISYSIELFTSLLDSRGLGRRGRLGWWGWQGKQERGDKLAGMDPLYSLGPCYRSSAVSRQRSGANCYPSGISRVLARDDEKDVRSKLGPSPLLGKIHSLRHKGVFIFNPIVGPDIDLKPLSFVLDDKRAWPLILELVNSVSPF